MKKRGLSEVITSLIIILLVLVAIGIVWVVVNNILNKSSEEITIDQFTNNIKIDEAKVGLLTAKVKITRTQGDATITSLKFILSNGIKTYEYEEKNNFPQQLETKTYEIPLAEGIKPTTIGVTPIFGKTIGIENSATPATDLTSATNNGLVAYYKFEGDAKDSSGNGNDGICSGANCPTYLNGKVGQSIKFSGSNQYINCGEKSSLNPTTGLTIMAWVNQSAYGNYNSIAGKFSYGYPAPQPFREQYFLTILDTSKQTKFRFYVNTTNIPETFITGNTQTEINKWYHIVGVYSAAKNISIYVNGIKDGETNQNVPNSLPSYNLNFTIGGLDGLSVERFNGLIDELIVFNRSLSDAEIKQIYDSQK